MRSIAFSILAAMCAAACGQTPGPFVDIRTEGTAERFSSGLTIYDEGLREGRLAGRYWSPIGRLRAEKDIVPAEFASEWADAFRIEIGGKPVTGGWERVSAAASADARPGQRHFVVTLRNGRQPLEVRVHTVLDGTPVLTRWLELRNTSEGPLPLSALAPFSGRLWRIIWEEKQFPVRVEPAFQAGYFRHSEWGQEGDFGWEAVPESGLKIAGRHGKSGWGNPFFVARNEASGEYFICALGWSGEWTIELRRERQTRPAADTLYVRAGPYSADPVMRVIAPGETVTSPAVHIGHLTGHLDDAVQAMHTHVRRSVLPPQPAGRAYLIQDNHWGYQTGVESEEGLRSVIDTAAAAGAELFIFDAGWYGKRRNDWGAQVGDWHPGPWLPRGLKPVVDYAHSKGLLFGLWIEPESLGSHTALFKEHPEFLVTRDGAPAYGSRGLDLAKPEVARWMEGEMDRVIGEYNLDLLRLDYNISDSRGGGNRVKDGFVENTLWRHYEALYGILGRLNKKYPKVIFENCAGGGGRTDLGILRFFHTTWVSDMSIVPKSLKILNGMTMLLPPEIVSRTYGTQTDEQRSYGDIDTQLRVAILAHPTSIGIAPSMADLNPPNLARVRNAFDIYKNFLRPYYAESRVFHHTPVLPFEEYGDWAALEYAARDGSRSTAGVFRLSAAGSNEYCFKPRGLKVSRRYRVRFDNSGESVVLGGFELAQRGVVVRLENGLRSELLLFDEVK
jgi:alpha-galactosidase